MSCLQDLIVLNGLLIKGTIDLYHYASYYLRLVEVLLCLIGFLLTDLVIDPFLLLLLLQLHSLVLHYINTNS